MSNTEILQIKPLELRFKMPNSILKTPIETVINFVDQESEFWPSTVDAEFNVRTVS